jgi:hypothetical protein
MSPTKRGMKEPAATKPPIPATDDKPVAPDAPYLHDLDDGEEGWQGSRIEQFTDAAGNPGPAVSSPGEKLLSPEGSPVMLASIAIYREPDGRLSLVREHVPQAFFAIGRDLLDEVKADLDARLASYGLE